MALPTLFEPSLHDQSLTYLYGIFGTVNGVIAAPGGETTGTMLTLLGALFSKFNTIMLAVGVLIVVYTTVVGIMNTAHEGQFMGKNWNNLWIPIRTVLGVAALVPTGSGYSGLQIVMMWVIVQGIGAADTLWSTAIGYYTEMGSIYAKVGVPTLEIKQSMQGVFQGLVCAKSAAQTWADPIKGNSDVKYFCAKNSSHSFCREMISNPGKTFSPTFNVPAETQYALGPDANCGTLHYCSETNACSTGKEDSLACKTCKAQRSALRTAMPVLIDAAEKYVQMDHDYMVYWSDTRQLDKLATAQEVPPATLPKPIPPPFVKAYCDADNNPGCLNLPSPVGDTMSASYPVVNKIYWENGLKPDLGEKYENFIKYIVGVYALEINTVVDEYMQQLRAESSTKLSPELSKANDQGWIVAGSYYFVISRGNDKNLTAMMPITSYGVDKLPVSNSSKLYGYRNNFKAADSLICLSGNGKNCSSTVSSVMNGPANGTQDAIKMYSDSLEDTNTDPLAQIMATGNMYLNIAEAIFWIFFAAVLIIGIWAILASFQILGTGLAQGGAPIVFEIVTVFTPLVLALCTWLIGIGAVLAVYVPLIPFTVFTLGAIGWMISTVEAMVAGPLVALGIISPSGQHEVLGKAEPALGLLFSIFLRPSLMIFGLFAAMLLSAQVMKLANAGFAMMTATAVGGGGMFKAIILMTTYVSFIVAMLNKTFSAIYIIPERVFSWISIQVSHEGVQELGEVKAGVDKGASEAGSVGKGAMDSAGSTGKAASAIRHEKRARGDDDKNPDVKPR